MVAAGRFPPLLTLGPRTGRGWGSSHRWLDQHGVGTPQGHGAPVPPHQLLRPAGCPAGTAVPVGAPLPTSHLQQPLSEQLLSLCLGSGGRMRPAPSDLQGRGAPALLLACPGDLGVPPGGGRTLLPAPRCCSPPAGLRPRGAGASLLVAIRPGVPALPAAMRWGHALLAWLPEQVTLLNLFLIVAL